MDITQSLMFMMPMAKWHYDQEVPPADGWKYENLVWDDLFYPKPSEEQLQQTYDIIKANSSGEDYRTLRKKHYPTAEEQLAVIYDVGIEGWKEYINNVKQNIPKPEVN